MQIRKKTYEKQYDWIYLHMETIPITTEYIKLQDFLKLGNLVSTGGEAKILIQDGQVTVNGEICLQRGKKLRPGDKVSLRGLDYTAVYAT